MNMHSKVPRPFRPIQYLGNKTRLLDDIAAAVASVIGPDAPVADLFSGTGVVGRRLAARNSVIAVDVQAYSEVIGRAMLQTSRNDLDGFNLDAFLARADESEAALTCLFAPLIKEEEEALASLRRGNPLPISMLIERGSALSAELDSAEYLRFRSVLGKLLTAKPAKNDPVATLAFGGVYFSFRQSIRLDALHCAAASERSPRRELLIATILGVASELVNTVGKQFAQPMRILDRQGVPKPMLMERTLRDRSLDGRQLFIELFDRWRSTLPTEVRPSRMVRQDVETFLEADGDWQAAYADPPYTIDHYSRFYHVLETLVRRDRPTFARMRKNGVPTVMRGLYREDRFQSDYCVPSRAPAAFERLVKGVARRGAPLVLSYSGHVDSAQRARTLPLETLIAIARSNFRSVEVTEPHFEGHRKLNASNRNVTTERQSERLIICRS